MDRWIAPGYPKGDTSIYVLDGKHFTLHEAIDYLENIVGFTHKEAISYIKNLPRTES